MLKKDFKTIDIHKDNVESCRIYLKSIFRYLNKTSIVLSFSLDAKLTLTIKLSNV